MALLDNDMQINTIMPSYVKSHSLEMGLITDLIDRRVACIGLGNAYTQPLGYVNVRVQVNGVQGYNEDQITLVVPDLSNITERNCVKLGTLTISHIINVMKEREIDALATPSANAREAHLLSVQRAAATIGDNQAKEKFKPGEYDEVVITKNKETVDAFSSHVIPMKAEKAYTGECINVMTQAVQTKDGCLLQGLTVQNAYTKLRKVAKMQLWWLGIVQRTLKLSRRKPQWPEQWLQWQWQNCQWRPGCQRGQMSLQALTHLN